MTPYEKAGTRLRAARARISDAIGLLNDGDCKDSAEMIAPIQKQLSHFVDLMDKLDAAPDWEEPNADG